MHKYMLYIVEGVIAGPESFHFYLDVSPWKSHYCSAGCSTVLSICKAVHLFHADKALEKKAVSLDYKA